MQYVTSSFDKMSNYRIRIGRCIHTYIHIWPIDRCVGVVTPRDSLTRTTCSDTYVYTCTLEMGDLPHTKNHVRCITLLLHCHII